MPNIIKTTQSRSESIKRLRKVLTECDCIIVGAGAGLSTSAGYVYCGERFDRYFADFGKKYGFDNMYFGGFTKFESPEEHWAYWSRYIYINRYTEPAVPVYDELLQLISGTDYFVITTNVDHCFQRAGFDKKRLFYTQGDYGLFQCSVPCCSKTFDNEEQVRQMYTSQHDMRVPTELIPKCPNCGEPVVMNLRADDSFIEDEGWHRAAERYSDFLRTRAGQRILFLELGVGYNTPGIIKIPFLQMTAHNPRATYACINMDDAVTLSDIESQSICINGDIYDIIKELRS